MVSDGKEEPFGFVDGISQPVIRGTYKGLRKADPIHLVEPGEFILGYPDNRGNTRRRGRRCRLLPIRTISFHLWGP